jgi:hypothetical protein
MACCAGKVKFTSDNAAQFTMVIAMGMEIINGADVDITTDVIVANDYIYNDNANEFMNE